jgi:hypothetical protein
MANTIASQVQALYVGYLGRAADQAGLDFWTNAITAGTSTLQSVALGFTLSTEYTALYAGKTNSELAAAIYKNVLGRDADAAGLEFWVGELSKGVQTPETLLAAMLNSLGTVDQQTIGNKVFVANAYTVAAGANYDVAAGAKILEGVNSNAGSVAAALATLPVSTATLTENLAAVAAADKAIADFVSDWGKANNEANPTPGMVKNAAELAEQALDKFLTDNGGVVFSGTFADYDRVDADGSLNSVEDAYLALVNTALAVERKALVTTVSTTTTALNTVNANLKSAVDAVVAAKAAKTLADNAELAASNRLVAASLQFQLDNTALVNDDVQFAIINGVLTIWDEEGTTPGYLNSEDQAIATFDGSKWTDGASAVAISDALKAAAEAFYTAATASDSADARLVASLQKVEGINGGQTAAADPAAVTVNTALHGESLAYANAVKAVSDFDTAKAALDSLAADVVAAREAAVKIVALEVAFNDAKEKLSALDVEVVNLADNDAVVAGTKTDVFLLTDLVKTDVATIFNFGLSGDDTIVANGYTLGSDITKGNVSVLEFFVKQVGADTVLTFETETYSSNVGVGELVTITLSGVSAADIVFENGLITLA